MKLPDHFNEYKSIVCFCVLFSLLLTTRLNAAPGKGNRGAGTGCTITKEMVCPRGWPLNEGVSKRIRPEGGVIASADGQVQVLFPAGAVTHEITEEITPLNNTNPAGNGLAYRLSPHGIQFKKPVSISFSYAAEDGSYRVPDVQGIAYQDETGTWQSVGGGLLTR